MADGFSRHYQHRPLGFARDLSLSALLGAGIGITFWLADPSREVVPQVAVSAIVGVCIYLVANALLFAVDRPLGRLAGWQSRFVVAFLFFLAGAGGWALAVFLVPIVTPWHLGVGGWGTALLFTGIVGIVVGLAFYSYEILRARLRDSAVRIHEQEAAEKELETARALQRRLLPPASVEGDGWRISGRNVPARFVAGDFYDLVRTDDGSVLLMVGDVAGKGLGASLVMASVKTMISFVAPGRTAAEALAELNRNLHRELGAREFVALCLVRYQPSTGAFELANAGLPDPYRLSAGTAPESLSCPEPRLPLGLRETVAYRPLAGRLAPGERMLLFSDGLPEALTARGEPLGYERLEELVAATSADGPPGGDPWLDRLFGAIEEETGSPREDDWTALLLEREG